MPLPCNVCVGVTWVRDVNGVSALRTTSIHFVEPGVEVNGKSLRCTNCQTFICCQKFTCSNKTSKPAQSLIGNARELICWPGRLETPSSHALAAKQPDLNPVDYKVWIVMQKVHKRGIKNVNELFRVSWQLGTNWLSALLIRQTVSDTHTPVASSCVC